MDSFECHRTVAMVSRLALLSSSRMPTVYRRSRTCPRDADLTLALAQSRCQSLEFAGALTAPHGAAVQSALQFLIGLFALAICARSAARNDQQGD